MNIKDVCIPNRNNKCFISLARISDVVAYPTSICSLLLKHQPSPSNNFLRNKLIFSFGSLNISFGINLLYEWQNLILDFSNRVRYEFFIPTLYVIKYVIPSFLIFKFFSKA